jgi:hypothetical protein
MRRKFYWLLLLLLGLPNLAVATREICGDPPPPQFKEESDKSIKGDLESEANLLSRWVGKAGLDAKIESTRKEIFAKYADANTANMDRYLGYMFCMLIFDPKNKQDHQDKMKAVMEFRQQQRQQPPPARSSSTPGPGGPSAPGLVSQITGFQLPGQPTLFHEGSNDEHYLEAKEVLESAADRQGTRVDRVEVIKWVNVDRPKVRQLWEGLLSELGGRGYDYNYSPISPGQPDPGQTVSWVEVYRLEVSSRARRQSIIGYWGVGYSRTGKYMLVWAWALLP